MKAIYNEHLVEFQEIKLIQGNRGFKYGDGLFETISFVKGQPRFISRHLERLYRGMKVLKMDENPMVSLDLIVSQVQKLKAENKIESRGKSRIFIWRDGEGLYSPVNNNTNVLLTLEKDSGENISFSENVGFCKNSVNYPTLTSQYKTISALQYVVAGIEKSERKLDDIIIKDQYGSISETLASNIFIKVKDTYVTPPLSTGCIDGIMRSWLIDSMRKYKISIQQETFSENQLLKSDCIFTSNSLGISHVKQVDQIQFSIDEQINQIADELDTF